MPTIDSLDIQISSSVNNANASLTTLIKRLDRVSASLSGVNSRGLATMGAGINKLSNAMSNFSANTRTADFSRLARNLGTLSTVDTSAFGKMASGISSISNSLSKIPNVSESASKFGELAKGISQLGYKSSTQAITNIPLLANAMKDLMRTLSGAPKVSQNLIDMTNALAKLARTGASSGRATNSLAQSLNVFSSSTVRARKSSFSLASAIGKLYATYFLLFRAFGKIGDSISIASDLVEIQNVADVTFGKYKGLLENMASTSIQDFGMSELTTKQVASRFQAMGTAMGFTQGKMADMSIELTKLTADMASFYNVEQKDVAEDLASIFTGQTRPLRTYGLDLTEATLKEWAMRQGMQANIDTMSQMEKTMLRYQYVMANTGAAQNDFKRTSESWANQIRILRQQFEQLGIVIGKTFISALKPLVKALNSAMSSIIAFAQTVSNALGKIFGWKFEISGGGITNDLESGADFADDIAGGLGTASDNAKKLKSYLLGIDELNVIEPVDTDSVSGGGGAVTGGAGATVGQWTETETIFENFESELDTLYKLGDYISQTLSRAMESINWDSVYEKARNFGTGLADFLNGLISPRLFGNVGKTIASALNTAIYASLSFAEEFDWEEFGESIATGINDFFTTFDFGALAKTLNTWVDGLKTTIASMLRTLKWSDILKTAGDFLGDLELDTIGVIIGVATIKKIGAVQIASTVFGTLGKKIGEKLGTAIVGALSFGGIGKVLMNAFPSSTLIQTITTTMAETGATLPAVLNSLILTPIKTFFMVTVPNVVRSAFATFGSWILHVAILGAIVGVANDIIEVMKGAFDTSDWSLGDWITNTLQTAWTGIYQQLDMWRVQIEVWWQDTWLYNELWELGQWWETYIAPWFTSEQWLTLFDTIKTSLNTKWTETATQWKTNITNWWNVNVAPWFAKTKWATLLSSIGTSFSEAFETAKSWVNTKLQEIYNAVSNMVSSIASKIAEIKNAFTGLGGISGITLGVNMGRVQQYATGGFPNSADIFYANENGVPELVGTIGSRTAVASGTEITGISDAVYRTGADQSMLLQNAVGLLQTSIGLLQDIADKELTIGDRDIARASARGQRSMGYTLITEG